MFPGDRVGTTIFEVLDFVLCQILEGDDTGCFLEEGLDFCR